MYKILLSSLAVTSAKADVKLRRKLGEISDSSLLIMLRIAGNSVNTTIRAVATPIIIIQPKVMIGRMPLTTSEPNATAVVSAVYRQGLNILNTE